MLSTSSRAALIPPSRRGSSSADISVKESRMIKNVWLHIVAERSGLHSDVIAPLNEKCWLRWPCVYSSDHTCVGHDLPSGQIICHWSGCIDLKIQRACCPDGCTPCNSSSSPLYTGQGRITGMLMAFHALRHHRADSAHDQTAHRPL